MPDSDTLVSEMVTLPSFSFADLVEQQERGIVEALRRAARERHLVGDLDAADRGARGFQQLGLDRGQRRAAAERDPGDVALRRPHEGFRFRHEAGFVVDQPHTGHGLDGGERAAAGPLRKTHPRRG